MKKAPVRGPWWRRRAGEKAARGNADARQMGGIRNGPRREDAKNPVRCPDRASFVRFQFPELRDLGKCAELIVSSLYIDSFATA
jgi:hypothetical protein